MTTYELAIAAVWMVSGAVCATPDNIAVVVFDYAGVSHADLADASREAAHVLNTAGVESAWSICEVNRESHCDLPPAGTYLEVKILPPSMDKALPKHEALAYAAKCAAAERCTTSAVFYGPVAVFAQDAGRPVSVALAYVMAHEIGHLMGLGHSNCGIMKERFYRRDLQDASQGRLRFGAGQALHLRDMAAMWIGTKLARTGR
jgi:hypothetical protein